MHLHRLQDRISRGLGAAARHIGAPCDAFRPSDPLCPLAPEARFLRLHASFASEDLTFRKPVAYGHPTWSGIFDTAYTRPGDYLAGAAGTFFIVAQQPLFPALCVLTNRTVSVSRAAAPTASGVNAYGGVTRASATALLAGWPASILYAGSGAPGDLPGDAAVPTWTILLPHLPLALAGADLITDEAGTSYVAASAEPTALGWRLLARQAAA